MVGETPNLAARLQALAEPGQRRHRPGDPAPGRRPVRADRSRAAAPQGLRRAARGLSGRGRGRAEGPLRGAATASASCRWSGASRSSRMLLRALGRAKDGDGQVVLLSGEPGIGKSRLVRALRERLGDEPHTPLSQLLALSHQQRAPSGDRAAGAGRGLRPRRSARGASSPSWRRCSRRGDRPAGRGRAADRGTAGRRDRASAIRRSNLTPQRQKQRTLAGPGRAAGGPGARAAGAGSSTRTCTGSTRRRWSSSAWLVERLRRLPVLVLITFRPEFSPPWAGPAARHARSTLTRLGRRQGAALVERLTGGKPLPAEIVRADRGARPTACRCSSRS